MRKNLALKLLFIIAMLLVFTYGILGIPKSLSPAGLKAAMAERIKLGLDLKGGTHLIMQVQVDEAVNAETDRAVERLREQLRARNVAYTEIAKPEGTVDQVVIRGVPGQATADLRSIVGDYLQEYELRGGPEAGWVVALRAAELEGTKKRAVTQAIETIRNRIDALGVAEPVIQEHGLGQHQILVQLPGVDDPARVREIMQSTAMLEIRKVVNTNAVYGSEMEARQALAGMPGTDAVVLKGRIERAASGQTPTDQWYLVSRVPAVSGRDLRDAQPIQDENGRPAVRFILTGDGGRRFANFTGQNVGELLAIVLDKKVMSVATIQEQIRDEGRITGSFTDQEVKDLSMILRSGALPASLVPREERTVGPSLGAESIRQGVTTSLIGLTAVLLFMLFYYRGAGINADLALILNLVILLGFLGFSGATLTLPGIAGVILTIGMGVDSNVLIFERIKEEMRAGKTIPQAVDQGFSRAWLTILDTHVTTIVSAAILFIFGTGPVRGFAVTLVFGLLANLFTSVFVSRVIFDWLVSRKARGEALSI